MLAGPYIAEGSVSQEKVTYVLTDFQREMI